MQTVRSYGRGRQGTPAPALPGLPDTTEATYLDRVDNFLDQGNYAELENLAQINRSERGRFLAGDWRNNSFVNPVVSVSPTPPPKDSG